MGIHHRRMPFVIQRSNAGDGQSPQYLPGRRNQLDHLERAQRMCFFAHAGNHYTVGSKRQGERGKKIVLEARTEVLPEWTSVVCIEPGNEKSDAFDSLSLPATTTIPARMVTARMASENPFVDNLLPHE